GNATIFAADPPAKEQFDELLKAYKLYELPFPPADAPLVLFPTGGGTYHKDKYRDNYTLGFQLKPAKEGGPVRVFWGLGNIRELNRREVAKRVESRPEALKDADSFVDIELAVQCYARGWTDLATAILERETGAKRTARRSPEADLARSAWGHWSDEYLRPETDRGEIARLLKIIMKRRADDFGESERGVLRSLELSLLPDKGKPGTVEALVDDLIDATSTDRSGALVRTREPHPAYMKLARLGFDAVPTLIEHLNDERLTRAYKQGFNNFKGYNYRIGDMVCDILQGFAGEDVGKGWLDRLQGYRLEKEAVEKWWVEAKKVGEEKYFVQHVLNADPNSRWPSHLILDVLAHKYPKRLPDVYRKMLDERTQMVGWEIADAVASSPLPKETKRALFERAAEHKVLSFRQDAISHLRDLDPAKALQLLIAELD